EAMAENAGESHGACLRALDQQLHGRREALPGFQLALQLLPPLARDRVELRVAPQVRRLPFRANPSLLLEAMERRIERALADRQRVVRQQLNALGEAPAVNRLARDGLEDQQIKRALEEIRRLRHATPRL